MQRRSRKTVSAMGGTVLDDFIRRIYLPHAKLRKRSWNMDERIARKHISPAFGSRGLESLQAREICDWHNGLLRRGYAPASCNRYLAVLKTILALAVARGFLPASPACQVAPFGIVAQRERCLSPGEALMLMRALEASDRPEAKAIMLLLLTGARKSEILGARWENLHFEKKVLLVPLSKSGRPRQVVLSGMALELLRAMARKKSGPWLFPGRFGRKPLTGLDHFWRKLRLELGLGDVRIHDLRHSFASFIVNSGHSLYQVQKLLGHRDPHTTMRYSHLGQESLVAAADAVGAMIFGKNVKKGGQTVPDSRPRRSCQTH